MKAIFSNQGYCNTCDTNTTFNAYSEWFRDNYICQNCKSIPRERALMSVIEKYYPNYSELSIHESSPCTRGTSVKLAKKCTKYASSHYYPKMKFGEKHSSGHLNIDLENQHFEDNSFDLVVTQDVMEHVFNPAMAFKEIMRTLKPGGAHIFTTPLVNKFKPSQICAKKDANGHINHLCPPEYHGNPIDASGSLVTMRWGYDITDYIYKNTGYPTTIFYIDDLEHGIRAEYIEVLITRKTT